MNRLSHVTIEFTAHNVREVGDSLFSGQLDDGRTVSFDLSTKDAAPEWIARHKQAKGELTKDVADLIVRVGRMLRRFRSAKFRWERIVVP